MSKLFDLAERLPRHSVYRAALADDEDTALAVLEQQGDGEAGAAAGFGMQGWTHERELLVGLTEAVLSLRAVTIAVASETGKVPKVTPLPRPRTAFDRVAAIQSKRKRQSLLAQVLPNQHASPS